MGLLSAAISTTDHQFKADVGRVLRASRAGVRVADSWRVGDGMTPDVIIADVRGDASGPGGASLDRLRSAYPASALVAVAATADPVRILEAMRAGANEFLDWPTAADLVAERDRSFMGALDRIAQKRQALAGDNRRVRTLAFFGAKGGVGTTTVATNVAVELARASKQPTVLVELKQFVGEAGVYLGVRPRYTLADAIDNLHRLDVPFLRELVVRHKSGLDILSGAEQPDRPSPPEAEAVEHVLRIVQSAYEHVVLDAGVVTSACAETAACHADTLYLVVTADVPCIRNTQRVVDRLTQFGATTDRIHILLNRESPRDLIAREQIEKAIGLPVSCAFASDYAAVSAALNAGVPLVLNGNAEIAGRLRRFTQGILGITDAEELAAKAARAGAFLGLF